MIFAGRVRLPQFVINAGTPIVTSDVYYDLSLAPAKFWGHVRADGGDVRVFDSADAPCAREISGFNASTQVGSLFIARGAGAPYRITYGKPALAEPAPSDPLGKYAVWEAAAKVVMHLEGSGADSTANGYDGTPTGSPTWTLGKVGPQCLNCGSDGVERYLATATVAHNIGTGDFSMFAWVNRTASSIGLVKALLSNGVYAPVLHASYMSSPYPGFYWLALHVEPTLTVPLNTWKHLALVRRSGVVYLYVDGITDYNQSIRTSMANAALRVGSDTLLIDQLCGCVDEPRFIARGLLGAEMLQHYQQQNAPGTFWSTGPEVLA